MSKVVYTNKSAIIYGIYRYKLTRTWGDPSKSMCFVGLNPSVADATDDDPTIRRLVQFAIREGCGRLAVVNLFAMILTDSKKLPAQIAPIGPFNRRFVSEEIQHSKLTVVGWGSNKAVTPGIVNNVILDGLSHVFCFGTNKDGSPKHPLYLKSTTPLRPWR